MRTAGAREAEIVGGHLQRCTAAVAAVWCEDQTVQRRINCRLRAREGQGTVSAAGTHREGQSAGGAQRHPAMRGGQGDLQVVAASVHITDGDRIAVATAEHQAAILLHALPTGYAVDGSVINRSDGQRQRRGGKLGAAGAAVAAIIDTDAERGTGAIVAGGDE